MVSMAMVVHFRIRQQLTGPKMHRKPVPISVEMDSPPQTHGKGFEWTVCCQATRRPSEDELVLRFAHDLSKELHDWTRLCRQELFRIVTGRINSGERCHMHPTDDEYQCQVAVASLMSMKCLENDMPAPRKRTRPTRTSKLIRRFWRVTISGVKRQR